MKTKIALLLAVIFLSTCSKNNTDELLPVDDSPLFMNSPFSAELNLKSSSAVDLNIKRIAVLMAQYLTYAESGKIGRTIYFFDVGNKQLNADFVPALSFLMDGTTDVSFYVDQNRSTSQVLPAVSSAAIARSMATWDGINCSDLGMYQVPYSNTITTGFMAKYYGYSGSYDFISDVTFCGWMPAGFFEKIVAGGSQYILAVTFTLIFTDDDGNPIDYDKNRKYDVAWREIYFNEAFTWRDGSTYDIETVALHEAGHGLSQDHFGQAFVDPGAGYLHFSPRAVMNAAYSGIQTAIKQTDLAGHCSIWADWPIH